MKNPALTQWLTQPDGIATRLGAMRRRSGLSGQELAKATGWSASKVSRLENGLVKPAPDDIRSWATVCGAVDEVEELVERLGEAANKRLTWRDRLALHAADVDAAYDQLLAQATDVAMVEVAMVPGPLQTTDYAEALFVALSRLNPIDSEPRARAEGRARRHDHIYDESKTFTFIITEGVLRAGPASSEVMTAQLDRLMTVLALGNVDLRVIPPAASLGALPLNAFAIYDRELVLVETFVDEIEHYDDADSRQYVEVFHHLHQVALGGDAARDLIVAAQRHHKALTQRVD